MSILKGITYRLAQYRQVRSVYETYLKRCEEVKVTPIPRKDFESTFEDERKTITYMIRLGRTSPYVIRKLGDDQKDVRANLYLFTMVKDKQVVINIWTLDEMKALLGKDPFTNDPLAQGAL